MKNMFVCGRKEIPRFMQAHEITHIISLHENRQDVMPCIPPGFPSENHLFIDMNDTSDASLPRAPNLAHIKTVFEFVDLLPDDAVLLVHCEAGVSRSPAMFIAIDAYVNGVDLNRLWDNLNGKRPMVIPNELILELASYLVDGYLVPIVELNDFERYLIR